jgi:hypothetical protein
VSAVASTKRPSPHTEGQLNAKLLDSRKPVRLSSDRGAPYREPDILQFVCGQRSRLETREAIKAGHFPKTMNSHRRLDTGKEVLTVRIPDMAVQCLRVQVSLRTVLAD